MSKKITKSEYDWKKELTTEQFRVCRNKGTEAPFSGEYESCKDEGTYVCICCGHELFESSTKFNSGTGWPSFSAPSTADSVASEFDESLLMTRKEVLCAKCDSHLGHVFEDGPEPTGLRYCINSVSLKLKKSES